MRYENPKMELLQFDLAEIICTSPGSVTVGGDIPETEVPGEWSSTIY